MDPNVVEKMYEEMQQYKQQVAALQEQTNKQRDEISKQRDVIEQIKQGNVQQTSTGLITLIFMMFLVGAVVVNLFGIVQVALLFSDYQETVLSTAFNIVNLLGSAWIGFGLGICLSHAPSLAFMRAFCALFVLGCCLEAIWAYFAFGIFFVVFMGIFALAGLVAMIASSKMFASVVLLPLSNSAFEIWLVCWRLFIIVVTPIVARIVQNGVTSQVAFFVVLLFCASMNMFSMTCRSLLAIYPSISIISLLLKLRIPTVIKYYSPIIGILIIFVVLYIIEVSDSSSNVAEDVIIALIIVAFFFSACWICVAFSLVLGWKFLAIFSPINSAERAIFRLSQKQGFEILGLSSSNNNLQ